MQPWRAHPLVLEINTWVWLGELRRVSGQPLDLGEVPDADLDGWAAQGFDAVWLMGVWRRSPAGRRIALEHEGLQGEFRRSVGDFVAEDVVGSPYAILDYVVDDELGGDEAVARLRARLAERGLRLLLDFVPNHLAVDHAWVGSAPERFVDGAGRPPGDRFSAGDAVLAHGRDPYFPGWTDTVQLDYRRPETRQAMLATLLAVAERCDGVRCDMAMLVLPDVFLQTWGGEWEGEGFWSAAIAAVRACWPDFVFMAEAYWDMERRLIEDGFDFAYDKTLYDRLHTADAAGVHAHLGADPAWQSRLVRFVENHDEPRVYGVFDDDSARVVTTLVLTLPGLRLVHEGQREGRSLRVPVQLGRRADEDVDTAAEAHFDQLMRMLNRPVVHEGRWCRLEARPEWEGNPTWRSFVAHRWSLGDEHCVVVANLARHSAQCFLPLDIPGLEYADWYLVDVMHGITYLREGGDLARRGLYLDVPAAGFHVFEVRAVSSHRP